MAADKRAARLGVLALVGTLLFSLVGARLWFLQTVEVDALQEQVDTTKLRTRALLPQRGRIFDADGRILADNQRSLAVTVDWELLRRDSDREEIFRRLSGWVDVAVEDMERRYERGITDTLLPMPVAEGLSEATAIAIWRLLRRQHGPIRTRRSQVMSSAIWVLSPLKPRTCTSATATPKVSELANSALS